MKLFANLTLTAALAVATSAVGQAQLLTPYYSQDGVSPTTAMANDSLADDALLVGIATSGPVDLSEMTGLPITAAGFNLDNGTSDIWAYQYLNSAGSDGIGIVLVKVPFVGNQLFAERGNGFGLDAVALDLSGEYAASNRMVEQLQTNTIFQGYREEFPDSTASFVVLSWRPDGSEFLPTTFPADSPIWSLTFLGGEFDLPEMACFVSSGTGETYCLRFSSGVDDINGAGDAIRVTPNFVTGGDLVSVTLTVSDATMPEHLGLFDRSGREVLDLSSHIASMHAGTPYEFYLPSDLFASGTYYIGAARDGAMTTSTLVIAR